MRWVQCVTLPCSRRLLVRRCRRAPHALLVGPSALQHRSHIAGLVGVARRLMESQAKNVCREKSVGAKELLLHVGTRVKNKHYSRNASIPTVRTSLLLAGTSGQATVESAVLLPSLMLLFALLLQPVCLSYTRAIMRSAAGECARAAATAYGGDVSACEAYARRRLRAVPEVPLFHVGGDADWTIAINRSSSHVDVSIEGHARPLPLMGAVASLASGSDGSGVVLRVSLSQDTRASWVGGDYGSWQKMWG